MRKMIGVGEWASELCRAFGEEPGEVRVIDLHIEVGEVVTVTIEKFVDRDNKKVLAVVKKVVWVEDEETRI